MSSLAAKSTVLTPVPGEAPRVLGLFTPTGLAMAVMIFAGYAFLFHNWFFVQHRHSWEHLEDWGHSYIIPVISAYLVYRQRAALAALRPEVFWPALCPFVLGVASYVYFSIGPMSNHMLQGFALVLSVFGVTLLVLGPVMMRYLFLPIAFLGLGVTIAEKIMLLVTFSLQALAAQAAYIVVAAIGAVAGFSAQVSGNVLTMIDPSGREIPLDVEEQCSGLRMVVAFIALAAATALIGCRYWWQRVMLVLLAAPVAILINIVRVSVLGVLSFADQDLAGGQAHMFIGTILLIPGMGLFMLVVWALNRAVRDDASARGGSAA